MEDTVITETIYNGPLGRIVAVPSQKTLDAWDWRGEYLGEFTAPSRAMDAMKEAQVIHQRLTNDYNNRKR
jgi:hypothetical protein